MRSAGRRGRDDRSRSTAESGARVADVGQPQERRSSVSYSLASEASIPTSIPGSKTEMNAMMNASCPPTVLAAMTAPLRGGSGVGSQKAARAASLLVHFPGDGDESSGDEGINRGTQRKKKKNFLMDRLREEEVHDGKQLTPRRRQQQQQQQQQIKENGHAHHKTAHHHTTSRRDSITSEVTTEADATIGDGTDTAADAHGHSIKNKDAEHGSSLESIDAPLEALLEGLQSDLEYTKQSLSVKEKQLKSTERQRDEVQKELKLVRAKLAKTRKERALLKIGKKEDENELSTARFEVESIRETLSKQSSTKNAEVEHLHTELDEIRDRLDVAEAAANAKENLLIELELEVERLNEDKANQLSTIESLTSQKEAQVQELDEMRQSLTVQREEVERLRSEADAATSKAEEAKVLASSATAADAELEALKKQNEVLVEQLKASHTEKDELASRQEDQIAKIETSKTVVRTLQNEIETLMKENAAKTEEIQKLSAVAEAKASATRNISEGLNDAQHTDSNVVPGSSHAAVEDTKNPEDSGDGWLDIEDALASAPNESIDEDDEDDKKGRRLSIWGWNKGGKGNKPIIDESTVMPRFENLASPTSASIASGDIPQEMKKLQEQLKERDELIQSLEATAEENKDTIQRLKSDFVLLRSSYKMKEYTSRKEVERLEEEVSHLNSELGCDGTQSMRRLKISAEKAESQKPRLDGLDENNDVSIEKTRSVVDHWINKTKASKNKKEAEELVESLQAEIVEMKARAHLAASEKDDQIAVMRKEKRDMENQVKSLEKAFKAMNTIAQFDPGTNDPRGARVVTTIDSLERLDQEIGNLRSRLAELEQALQMQTIELQEERQKSAALKEALRETHGDRGEIPVALL